MSRNSVIDLALTLISENKEAIQVSDGKHEAWLPKMQIEYRIEPNGTDVTVTLPVWMARNKELV